jgi:hypothetical protein
MNRNTRWNAWLSMFRLSLLAISLSLVAQLAVAQTMAGQPESSTELPQQGQSSSEQRLHDNANQAAAQRRIKKLNPQPKQDLEASTRTFVLPLAAQDDALAGSLEKWTSSKQPLKPQRPLPLVLFFMGLGLLVLGAGVGILAFLLLGIALPLGIVTILLWVIFGLVGLLGLLLMVSAVVMASAGGKKPKQATPPAN